LATSWRTSCKNLKGLTFAIVSIPIASLPDGPFRTPLNPNRR